MVRLIEDEQGTGAKIAKHVAQTRHVVLLGEKAMREDKARAGGPRIDGKAADAPELVDALSIHNIEGQTELALQLGLQLCRHSCRGGNDDVVDASAQQQLARDQPCFDRLAVWAYLDAASPAVTEMGGKVAKKLGRG